MDYKSLNRIKISITVAVLLTTLVASSFGIISVNAQPDLIDPSAIPKFVNQLTSPPPVYVPKLIANPAGTGVAAYYEVTMSKTMQQVLPTVDEDGNPTGFNPTEVWGYGGQAQDALTKKPLGFIVSSPGPSFEAIRGRPSIVKWVNNINTPHMFAVDPTLHWANPNRIPMMSALMQAEMGLSPPFPPGYNGQSIQVDGTLTNPEKWNAQSPVPLVTHLHGGEVQSRFDGNPDAWMTYNGIQGPAYSTLYPTSSNTAVYYYPNEQPATTLWYHDHALGVTRLNVMSGLAGAYLLRDNADALGHRLDAAVNEMPLIIQDRTFQANGNFYFPADEATNPDVHPYWSPEFFGNTIIVNGLAWPNMDVERGLYRLRFVDGSNARFYTLSFEDTDTGDLIPFTQIGTDGGYIKSPTTLTSLTIAPGERADVLVDFSNLPEGTKVLLKNSANAPFPDGDPVDENTAQIMQFTTTGKVVHKSIKLPDLLNNDLKGQWPTLPAPTKTRYLTLVENMGPGGPLEVLLNGQKWSADISENVTKGTTEEWVIINLTADTHPIHLHLTQFQLVKRVPIDTDKYMEDWTELNGEPPYERGDPIPKEIPIKNYTTGAIIEPEPNEHAWKDTLQMNPGEATIIRVRFAPIDGDPSYPFDPTNGPGYVWHCHILDHEDNEMMRPYLIK